MIKLAVVDGHISCSVVGSAKGMCPGLGFRGLGYTYSKSHLKIHHRHIQSLG
jgi:hypothetical protein